MTSSGGETTRALVRSQVVPIEGRVDREGMFLPALPPEARFIPAPFEGYEVKTDFLTNPTTKAEKRWLWTSRERNEGYWYIGVDDVKKRLNKAYGNGGWSFWTTEGHRHLNEKKTAKNELYIEVTVEGWLRAPFILEPGIKGVGVGRVINLSDIIRFELVFE